jgi:hypothetical protein
MEPIKNFAGSMWAKITFVFLSLFLGVQSWAAAQGIDVDVNTGKSGGAWYTTWYFWAGAALFILALVAIVSAGRRRT